MTKLYNCEYLIGYKRIISNNYTKNIIRYIFNHNKKNIILLNIMNISITHLPE